MKTTLLPTIALSAIFSTCAFAAGTDHIQLQETDMGAFTSVTALNNGKAMANTQITVANQNTLETYTTNSDGVAYISNISHGNKTYTLQVKGANGQTASTQYTFAADANDN
ncbi:hypothetical protein [Vibrio marisflavi]|uniref:Uncharacterized protein n=1 Tax=Vibrio marisflavi CECT 7928 TaxID=634439 RepID=A0ABM9A8S5_9VIBR|nr:hypothetical protein [Vibrio marisflavi]CAH0542015.1 hypothetical protein VMF7928_04026 [Vibrio marisflavi CECT 7928]